MAAGSASFQQGCAFQLELELFFFFFKKAGVGVGFKKVKSQSQFFELEQFMGWSRNPKKSSDSTTLVLRPQFECWATLNSMLMI